MISENIINELNNKRIFITGGTGFFGKSILDYLIRNGIIDWNITILSRNASKFIKNEPYFKILRNLSFVDGDVRNFHEKGDYDYIIHAATPAVANLSKGEHESIIIEGTRNTLEFARCSNVKRFLMISSGAVYGAYKGKPFVEIDKCYPSSEYGISKYKAEQLCLQANIDISISRCFAFIGKYLPFEAHYAIGNFIQNCLENKPIVIKGNGTPVRSYMYADDLVEWLLTLLVEGKKSTTYNVGSDEAISIFQLANVVKNTLKSNSSIEILYKDIGTAATDIYIPDISFVKKTLGVKIHYSLVDAIYQSVKMH